MIPISCKSVLLDIEGTVSPVAFVFDVMFPYARDHAGSFLFTNWTDEATRRAVEAMAIDYGFKNSSDWFGSESAFSEAARQKVVMRSVYHLMDNDAKLTGLKSLQGLIWRKGFETGQLVSELFPDVVPRLRTWKACGLDLYIYSSGSITAQKLFFGHTGNGNLLQLFSGFFDTTSGNKKVAKSYRVISESIGCPTSDICFISDVVAELDAARESGMQTILRPAAACEDNDHPVIDSFAAVELVKN